MKIKNAAYMIMAVLLITALNSFGNEKSALEIMKESHLAMFYAGQDGVSEVRMTIVSSRGKERIREFAMLRLDIEEGGKQDYYMYFRTPHDVSRMTFMVHKLPDANDNRWLYIPAVDYIKRISADDKTASFVGSDFSYEDVSGRHWTEDNHELIGEEKLNENEVYIIESIPIEKFKGFSKKVSYIDKGHYLPLKEEYYDKKGNLIRLFTAEKFEEIDGFMTSTFRKMENVKKKQYTTVEFSSIKYNVGIGEEIFTERFLRNPPRKLIK